ncbi:hypothetical protein HDV05_008191 [Chytridiales sp. JEL 0842]|nr:hypothetical protein HDV05_008191 [Chytridiales sp. JEL 0842]
MATNQESDDGTPASLLADLSLTVQSPIVHPSGLVVRVFDVDEVSVSSSTINTSEASGADESLDDEDSNPDLDISSSMEQHIERHKKAFIRFLKAKTTIYQPRLPNPTSTNTADPILHKILNPSASRISYSVMHPLACRHMKPIFDLDDFAKLINAPTNWKSLFDEAWDDACIDLYNDFVGLPEDSLEANVHLAFVLVVYRLSHNLSIKTRPFDQTKVRIGGVTALPEYDYPSVSDVKFVGTNTNRTLFCTEIKTASSWALHESWYRYCRLAQVLAALYGHNAPALLFTQQQFKLFVENSERDTIYTFPFGNEAQESTHTNASICYKMSELFFQVIAICLLCEPRTFRAAAKKKVKSITGAPVKLTNKDSPEKRGASVKKNLKASQQTAKSPSFISGYTASGGYLYQSVTIYNIDEDEEKERMESSATLFVDDSLSDAGYKMDTIIDVKEPAQVEE